MPQHKHKKQKKRRRLERPEISKNLIIYLLTVLCLTLLEHVQGEGGKVGVRVLDHEVEAQSVHQLVLALENTLSVVLVRLTNQCRKGARAHPKGKNEVSVLTWRLKLSRHGKVTWTKSGKRPRANHEQKNVTHPDGSRVSMTRLGVLCFVRRPFQLSSQEI